MCEISERLCLQKKSFLFQFQTNKCLQQIKPDFHTSVILAGMAEVCHCVAVTSISQHMCIHIHKADGELKTQGLVGSNRGSQFYPGLT